MSALPHQTEKHKHCRRYDELGDAHSLTFSCFQRRAFLSKNRARDWLVDSLDSARAKLKFDIWAYVIMPEHAHLLIWPREATYSISAVLSAIKVPVTRRATAFLRHTQRSLVSMEDKQPNGKIAYRFWQRGGGYDRNIISAHTVHATIEYIHANPVRRGLVPRAEDWPWSSARFFGGATDVPLRPDRESIPRLLETR